MFIKVGDIVRPFFDRLSQQPFRAVQVASDEELRGAGRQLAGQRRCSGGLALKRWTTPSTASLPQNGQTQQETQQRGDEYVAKRMAFGLAEEGLRVITLDLHPRCLRWASAEWASAGWALAVGRFRIRDNWRECPPNLC